MMVGAGISVAGGKLKVLGNSILSDVHDNIFVTPATGEYLTNGAFIGVQTDRIGSQNVFPIGKLKGLRYMCVFRFQMWWMTQRMGTSGQDIPFETQFLIVERRDDSYFDEKGEEQSASYIVFLLILEGNFRVVLQGNANNELDICLESGDPAVQVFEGSHLVLVAAGSEPFDVIMNAVKSKCHYSWLDVQNILETLGAGHGGRVKLARKYHQALEASISRNFLDNGIISCMSHNTNGLYRVGTDSRCLWNSGFDRRVVEEFLVIFLLSVCRITGFKILVD
ncbi:putative galactinol--sucrose galactosyltransferase 1 [Forsythia ovata]|uniref:Galactinol--sucrose galactosyltransferase 1 n=1 Tax=Forsythia ovata TaxID=205694 RepID=A0ABD1X425_9LAMI